MQLLSDQVILQQEVTLTQKISSSPPSFLFTSPQHRKRFLFLKGKSLLSRKESFNIYHHLPGGM